MRQYGCIHPGILAKAVGRQAEVLNCFVAPPATWRETVAAGDLVVFGSLLRHELSVIRVAYAAGDAVTFALHAGIVVDAAVLLAAVPRATDDLMVPGLVLALARDDREALKSIALWFCARPDEGVTPGSVVATVLLAVWTGRDDSARRLLGDFAVCAAASDPRAAEWIDALLFCDAVSAGIAGDVPGLAVAVRAYADRMLLDLDCFAALVAEGGCEARLPTSSLCDVWMLALLRILGTRGVFVPPSPFFDPSFCAPVAQAVPVPRSRPAFRWRRFLLPAMPMVVFLILYAVVILAAPAPWSIGSYGLASVLVVIAVGSAAAFLVPRFVSRGRVGTLRPDHRFFRARSETA